MQIVFARRNFRSRHPSNPDSRPDQTDIHLHVSCKYSISSSFQPHSRLSTLTEPSTRLYQAPTPIGCSLLKSISAFRHIRQRVDLRYQLHPTAPACCFGSTLASLRICAEAVNGEANNSPEFFRMQHPLGCYFTIFFTALFRLAIQRLAGPPRRLAIQNPVPPSPTCPAGGPRIPSMRAFHHCWP